MSKMLAEQDNGTVLNQMLAYLYLYLYLYLTKLCELSKSAVIGTRKITYLQITNAGSNLTPRPRLSYCNFFSACYLFHTVEISRLYYCGMFNLATCYISLNKK